MRLRPEEGRKRGGFGFWMEPREEERALLIWEIE